MKTKTPNHVLELPPSCRSKAERMEAALEMEELEEAQAERCACQNTFRLAKLDDCCQEKLTAFEQELQKQGCWNVSLVAYQKDC